MICLGGPRGGRRAISSTAMVRCCRARDTDGDRGRGRDRFKDVDRGRHTDTQTHRTEEEGRMGGRFNRRGLREGGKEGERESIGSAVLVRCMQLACIPL